jgi:hypothetical protein
MILIKSVHVIGFRSLENCRLEKVDGYHALVGKNSSGKSNIIRALNLFFNDEVESGRPLSFDTDYFAKPQRKQKRRISIRVEFELPSTFKFRKQQAYLKRLGHQFTIERVWELDQRRQIKAQYHLYIGKALADATEDIAPQFLQLVTFRYIPNRSVPADIIRRESKMLATSLIRRMKTQTAGNQLISDLIEAAGSLFGDATKELTDSGAPLRSPQVATSELSEMLSMSGFQARALNGGYVQDENWGAGHQAFFLYQVLRALDTDYRRYFGWRQATIWAVEEPESALHRELESRLAMLMRQWTTAASNRLQILMTTHSPVFAMAADGGDWICLNSRATDVKRLSIPDLVRAAEREGISGWTQPLLTHPFSPVVLCEGPIDAAIMNHVAELDGRGNIRFLALPSIDEDERAGGKDAIISHLKRNKGLLSHRLSEAPVVVMFDWDVNPNEMKNAKDAYGEGASDRVIQMNPKYAVPSMGESWKGVERFYPVRVIGDAAKADEISIGNSPTRGITVAQAELSRGKLRLRDRMLKVTDRKELAPLIEVLRDVEQAIESARKTKQ